MSADLVAALKQRDPLAFERLLAQHGAMLYRVAARFMGQREEAEEVVQETLLTVFEKIHTFDEKAALSTWLYRIVVNTALMRLRSKARAHEAAMEPIGPAFTAAGEMARDVAEWDLSPEDALLRHEALTVLRQGVDRLPEAYRTVYVLAEIEGLPHQEIATMLELSPGAVKVRLHRARIALREALAGYFRGIESTKKRGA
jgi:RNA polymerase sigma-70 factor (ECF subfamily)